MVQALKISLAGIISTGLLLGCSAGRGTGNTVTRTSAYPRLIQRAVKEERYFVLYSGLDTFNVTSVLVGKGRKQFTVHLQKPDSLHRVLLSRPGPVSEKQIRVYLQDTASYTLDEPHTVPLSKVIRIELVP